MLVLAVLALANAAETDLSTLATALDAVENRVHLPIVVATSEPALVARLNALDREHDELSLVVVALDPQKGVEPQMTRALSRRAMRCGVFVEEKAGVWNVSEFGRCGGAVERAPAIAP